MGPDLAVDPSMQELIVAYDGVQLHHDSSHDISFLVRVVLAVLSQEARCPFSLLLHCADSRSCMIRATMREAAKASAAKSRQALAPTSKNVSRPRNIKSGVQKEEPVIKKEETTPQKSSSTRSTRKRAAPASDSSTSKKLKVNKEDAKPLQFSLPF